jgi:hypothetical protein
MLYLKTLCQGVTSTTNTLLLPAATTLNPSVHHQMLET